MSEVFCHVILWQWCVVLLLRQTMAVLYMKGFHWTISLSSTDYVRIGGWGWGGANPVITSKCAERNLQSL